MFERILGEFNKAHALTFRNKFDIKGMLSTADCAPSSYRMDSHWHIDNRMHTLNHM